MLVKYLRFNAASSARWTRSTAGGAARASSRTVTPARRRRVQTAAMRYLLTCLLVASTAAMAQQQPPQYGCDSPESKQLDFWVGDWELSYKSGEQVGTSRNR